MILASEGSQGVPDHRMAAGAVLAAALAVSPAAAAPGPSAASGIALVIGNGAYDYLPPLPACPASARTVASALQNVGFEVVEKEDVTSGEMEAAFIDLSRRLAAAPGMGALVYVCGYAGGYDGRDFLLPVSAAVAHPPDLLAQGVLAKSLLDALTGTPDADGLLLIDAVPLEGGAGGGLGFEGIKQATLPDRVGAAAAIETKPTAGPTPVAKALVAGLHGQRIETGALLLDMAGALSSGSGASFAAVRSPAATAVLVGAPSLAPPATTPSAAAAAHRQPPAPAAPAPAPAASVPATVAPVTAAPMNEAQMGEPERRRVQIALAQLGYYDGRIDGAFGPETRAAIRRFQHEIKADMTGVLTPSEAGRLLAAAR